MAILVNHNGGSNKRTEYGRSVGQALVETAIIAPLLIFFLIGIFEVGWALRGYLVIINGEREMARFAVRPDYLNYTSESYERIVAHGLDSMSHQVEFSGTVIISVLKVETQQVCDPDNKNGDGSLNCDCGQAVTSPFSPTLVMSPLNTVTATYKYPLTATETTRLDYSVLLSKMVTDNRLFNCKLMKNKAKPAIDEQVIVEMFYYQPQLFGFPIIANPLTNPVRMYANTTFRKIDHR